MAYARPALFHAFAKDAANLLVGVGPNRPRKAWSHIYRSLQHGDAKTACEAVRNLSFPATIVTCAEAFVTLQQERHDADYNPDYRVLPADALSRVAQLAQRMASAPCDRFRCFPARRQPIAR